MSRSSPQLHIGRRTSWRALARTLQPSGLGLGRGKRERQTQPRCLSRLLTAYRRGSGVGPELFDDAGDFFVCEPCGVSVACIGKALVEFFPLCVVLFVDGFSRPGDCFWKNDKVFSKIKRPPCFMFG